MFKIGDKVECTEGHTIQGGGVIVPKGFQGTVQETLNCPSCGVQYIYLGFQWPSDKQCCSVCQHGFSDIPEIGKRAFSRCTRFRLLEESNASNINIELEPKKIIKPETIVAN